MKLLFACLVLSTLAVVGVAVLIYVRIRRHMAAGPEQQTIPPKPASLWEKTEDQARRR